uniref:Uncharacterized protein n=1 Tax=Tanacetum cinerariifolium TaxID=118510 RepID=A0A6L2KN14_TANCI|nr:hypothetical protein [Tanacetum cinerariifolium]
MGQTNGGIGQTSGGMGQTSGVGRGQRGGGMSQRGGGRGQRGSHTWPMWDRNNTPPFEVPTSSLVTAMLVTVGTPSLGLSHHSIGHHTELVGHEAYVPYSDGLGTGALFTLGGLGLPGIVLIISGDDDIVAFGRAALRMWCLQPWQVPMLVTKPQVPLELGADADGKPQVLLELGNYQVKDLLAEKEYIANQE